MRRFLVVLSVVAMSYTSSPSLAVAQAGRGACEGYCATVAAGCYIFVGWAIGRDKCDSMYRGCMDGCIAALLEE